MYTFMPIYNIKLTRPLPFLPAHDKTLPNKYPYPNTHPDRLSDGLILC